MRGALLASGNLQIDSGPASTFDEWWQAESTKPGVTFATDFNASTDVTNFRHEDGTQANVQHDTTDRVPGSTSAGCMKLVIPASSGPNPGSWRHWLRSDGNPMPTEFWFLYYIKLGPRRLRSSNGGGGFKTAILSQFNFASPNSSQSNQIYEIVHNTSFGSYHGMIQAYRQDGSGFPAFHETIGGEIRLQPAIDWGAGLPDQRRYSYYLGGALSEGGIVWREGEWLAVKCRVKIVTPGGTTGNEFDMWVQGEADAAGVQLYSARTFQIGGFGGDGGYTGIHLTGYDTGRTNADYDTWHKHGPVIFSTADIAFPPRIRNVPAWYTAQTEKTWSQPVSNTLEDIGATQGIFAFGGGYAIQDSGAIAIGPAGGHTDEDSNAVRWCQLRDEAPAWATRIADSTSNTSTPANGAYADGQPISIHTWKMQCDVPGDGAWMAGQPGMYQAGSNGGRFWRLATGATAWSARGYRPGASSSVYVTDADTLGAAEYDPQTGLIHIVASQGVKWTINPFTDAAVLGSAGEANDTNYYFAAALSTRRRCFALWQSNTNFRLWNLDTGVRFSPGCTGTGPTISAPGMEWSDSSGGFIVWGHSASRANLFKLTPPASFGDTFTSAWTWSSIAPDASNSVTPASSPDSFTHGRMKILRNFGGERRDIVTIYQGVTDPVRVYKLPVGGI